MRKMFMHIFIMQADLCIFSLCKRKAGVLFIFVESKGNFIGLNIALILSKPVY
jgi:hypothetical protein